MLIQKSHYDVPTKLDAAGRPIRIYVISPVVPDYPNAKFPGWFQPQLYLIAILLIMSIIRRRRI